MARGTDPTPGRQRLLGLAAVASLAAATAFAFGRVFAGRLPTWQLVAAAIASVGVAALFERRGLLLATTASLIGLALAITWLILPQTAWYGLPSIRTLRALGRSLEFVGQQARVRVAPTPALPPLMLAALTAIWTASFSAHALAIRAGSPLLAVLPMAALVGFADAVLEDGARPIYAVTFLAAALAVVFSDGLRRIRQWGPVWSPTRSSRIRASVKGSRAVAGLVVLFAILVPGLLPGFRATALVDFSTSGDDGVDLDPFVSILAQLDDDQAAIDLFQVRAEQASYWRLYALDEFDGTTWTSSDPYATERGQVLDTPAVFPLSDQIPKDAPVLSQSYKLLHDVDDGWLPMAAPAESITLPAGEVTYDPTLSQALVEGGLNEGLEYTVTSRVVNPSPQELEGVTFLTAAQYGRNTQVSGSVDPLVGEIAERWSAGKDTPYEKIYAIQQHFRNGFEYSTDVEPKADADALLDFLTVSRRGFCQQFATTMAIMVRKLGYPARVAVGYRSGTLEEGVFTVRSKDAHAWVEVFFPGQGWLAFEPTPTRANPLAEPGTYLNPTAPVEGGPLGGSQQNENDLGRGGPAGCRQQVGPNERALPAQLCNTERGRPGRGGVVGPIPGLEGQTAPEEPGYSVPYRWIFLGLLVIGGLLLVFVPIVKAVGRRIILRRPGEPRERVLAAYRVFDGEATDLGMGRRDGETLEEHRARLAATVAFADGHLDRLTSAAARAAYSPEMPSPQEAKDVASEARRAIRDLRKDAGWLRRAVGTYRPGI